jgi:hypothetical protein
VGPLDFLIHLLGFIAPALVVAALVAFAGRVVLSRNNRPQRWWFSFALNFLVGVAALLVGLFVFGRDGKMATYGLLVVAVATSQWLSGKGWRT